ncbi:MAG TPA: hypothetical protein VEJ19_07985 [Nitrososphaerales archaeon]|nr:hypothetical protein [Nitrososphaerales archaeon]
MPKIYWMSGYNIREGMVKKYQTFLKSKTFKKLSADFEKETGIKYLATYGTILPSSLEEGDYMAYDLMEMPNHAALDKIRNSKTGDKLWELSYKYVEPTPVKSVLLRLMNEVKVGYEPEK